MHIYTIIYWANGYYAVVASTYGVSTNQVSMLLMLSTCSVTDVQLCIQYSIWMHILMVACSVTYSTV